MNQVWGEKKIEKNPSSDARQEIKQRGALMQLQGAVARAAAVVEEFRAVYLPALIFFTGANNSSSVPSETKKKRKEKIHACLSVPQVRQIRGFWSGLSLALAGTEMGCDSQELGTKFH